MDKRNRAAVEMTDSYNMNENQSELRITFLFTWQKQTCYTQTDMKIKGIVHTKILSSFTHLHLVPNLNDWLISVKHKISYFKEHWGPEFFTFIIWTKTFNFHFWVNYRFKHFSVEIRCFTQSDIQFKGIVHQKRQFCDHLLPFMLFQTCMAFFCQR